MTAPTFCYLAAPDKRVAMIEHQGHLFVPIFGAAEDVEAFCRRCGDHVSGYAFYVVAQPEELAGFLEMVRGVSAHVGFVKPLPEGGGEVTFAVVSPERLARAFQDPVAEPKGR